VVLVVLVADLVIGTWLVVQLQQVKVTMVVLQDLQKKGPEVVVVPVLLVEMVLKLYHTLVVMAELEQTQV
jgi:hypothetical protein